MTAVLCHTSVQADVFLSLICNVAAPSNSVTWAHVLAPARLLTVQPVEAERARWGETERQKCIMHLADTFI